MIIFENSVTSFCLYLMVLAMSGIAGLELIRRSRWPWLGFLFGTVLISLIGLKALGDIESRVRMGQAAYAIQSTYHKLRVIGFVSILLLFEFRAWRLFQRRKRTAKR